MEFEDHGDESVDKRYRDMFEIWGKLLGKNADAILSAPLQPDDEGDFIDYVPPELRDHGTLPDSLFICEAIPNGPEDV